MGKRLVCIPRERYEQLLERERDWEKATAEWGKAAAVVAEDERCLRDADALFRLVYSLINLTMDVMGVEESGENHEFQRP